MLGAVIGRGMYVCERSKKGGDVNGRERVLWERWGQEVRMCGDSNNVNNNNFSNNNSNMYNNKNNNNINNK